MFRSDCHVAPQRAADFSSTLPSVASIALSRRACLGGGLAALALLAGCKPATVPFKGIDLTGAQYGRDFRLRDADGRERTRSEEHTSELQSPCNLVCRLLLEKKKKSKRQADT